MNRNLTHAMLMAGEPIYSLRAFRPEGGRMTLHDSGGDAPDQDPAVGIAALKSAELGDKWFNFYEQAHQESKPRQAELDNLTREVMQQGLSSSKFQDEQARSLWQRYNEKIVPMEDKVFAEAAEYGSAADQEREAARASATVAQQIAGNKAANSREMARMGINPNSVRFQSVQDESGILGALGEATAANDARDNVREKGIVMRQNAAAIGRGIPGMAQATFGGSQSAGAGAVSAATNGIQTSNASTGLMGQGFGGAMQGLGQQATILNADYRNRLGAWQTAQQSNDSTWSTVGSMAGVGIMAMSDRRLKTDIEHVAYLANGLPVYGYKYVYDGIPRLGVMADEVEEFMPEAIVVMEDGYKAVNYSMLGRDAELLVKEQ